MVTANLPVLSAQRLLLIVAMAFGLVFVSGCGDEESTGNDTCEGAGCVADGGEDLTDTSGEDLTDTAVDTNREDTADSSVDTEPDVTDTAVEDSTDTTVEDTTPVDVGDAVDTELPSCGYGGIHGRVCSPNGSDWLSDVEVSVSAIDCDGNPVVIQDFTDGNGFYNLDNVPAGLHQITIRTGSYTTSIDNVKVEIGKTTDLTGTLTKTCLDRRSASIAVLTGTFDHVEQILDNLGITYQLYEGDSAASNPNSPRSGLDLLLNINELLTYDILFINCGEWYTTFTSSTEADIQMMHQNLNIFVQSGGSIYASDWAYFWAELAFPTAIDFVGEDTIEGEAKRGAIDENLVANVISDGFRNALGGVDTMTIKFNWPAWVVAESVSFSSTVHILAPTVPTFGDPLVNVPLVISYKPSPTSGTVFFTSFHQEAQLTSQMEQVLRFLVFQL